MSVTQSSSNLSNPINILQWNVRSLSARLPSLLNLLSLHRCSVALLSETWLLPSHSINIPNFVSFRSDRHDGYGEVAIVIHNSLKSRPISLDVVTKNSFLDLKIDLVGAEVFLPNSSSSYFLWSCYIPSDTNIPPNIWHSLFSLIRHNSLLGGDFNAFHPAWGSHSASRRGNFIYDNISSLGLCFLNDGSATHLERPGSPDSAIDLSFCSPNLIWKLTWTTFNDPHGSDHIPILISLTSHLDSSVSHSFGHTFNSTLINLFFSISTKLTGLLTLFWFKILFPPCLIISLPIIPILLSQILLIMPPNLPFLFLTPKVNLILPPLPGGTLLVLMLLKIDLYFLRLFAVPVLWLIFSITGMLVHSLPAI